MIGMNGDPVDLSGSDELTVNLTYFKPGGKYYCDGAFKVEGGTPLFKIWHQVHELKSARSLPGINGADWTILIRVPDHPHDHPHIIPYDPLDSIL